MAIDVFTHAVGTYHRSQTYLYKEWFRGVSTSDTTWSNIFWSCYKSDTTKNKVRILPGTKIPWRNPSPYARGIIKWTEAESVHTYTAPERMAVTSDGYLIGNAPSLTDMLPVTWPSFAPAWNLNDRNRAETECLLKLNESKVQLLADLGEARKTVNMIAKTSTQVVRALLAIKRGNWSAAAKILGLRKGLSLSVAERWLEVTYGWKPLLQDIYGLNEVLTRHLEKGSLISAKRSIRDANHISEDDGTYFKRGNVRWSTRVKLYATLDNDYLYASQSAGIINPLSVVWELTPFSFVVDWFAPVGNLLEALTATVGLTFAGGDATRWAEGQTTVGLSRLPGWMHSDYSKYNSYRPSCKISRFGFRRETYAGFPFPKPYVKSPFSTGHVLNATALIRQLWR